MHNIEKSGEKRLIMQEKKIILKSKHVKYLRVGWRGHKGRKKINNMGSS
jgi:hypothetical protein